MRRTLQTGVLVVVGVLALFVLLPTLVSIMDNDETYVPEPYVTSSSSHSKPPPCTPASSSSSERSSSSSSESVVPTHSNVEMITSLSDSFKEKVKHIFDGVEAVVLMDHPEYRNRGDSALYMGEVNFIRSLDIPIIYECSQAGMVTCDTDWIQRILDTKTGLVCFSGGGNFGDLWPWLREAREKWLAALKDYRIFQFPQTVHFKNMDTARYSATLWAAHPNITVSVRDTASVAFLKEYFPTTPVIFAPDAAFLLGPLKRFPPKYDMMWLMRADKETAQSQYANYSIMSEHIKSLLPSKDITIRIDDWLDDDAPNLPSLGEQVLTRRAHIRTMDGLRTLSSGKIVVSDRLHAHILTTLAEIPHVILDNENGKVYHVHEAWTSRAFHIKLATSLPDAMNKALELLKEYNDENGVDEEKEEEEEEYWD